MASLSIDKNTYNKAIVDALRSRSFDKFAAASDYYIRTKMYEEAFCKKILTPETITRAECQRSTTHELPCVIKDIAPDAEAVALTFRGEPDHAYVTGNRFEIGFYEISTLEYQKSEKELFTYEMPLTQLLEEVMIKSLAHKEDEGFMKQVDDCVKRTGKDIQVPTFDHKIDKDAIIELRKQLDGDRLETACMLMNVNTYLDLSRFDSDKVDQMSGKLLVDGYREKTILGVPVYVTMKNDIVKHNEVYAFCAPQYLGYFYVLDEPKFWVESKKNILHMQAWEEIGVGFGNSRGMAKLTII